MKLYKNNIVANVTKEQLPAMEKTGWSRKPPEPVEEVSSTEEVEEIKEIKKPKRIKSNRKSD